MLAVLDLEVSRAGGDEYEAGRELIAARAAVDRLILKADTAATILSNLIAAQQVDARYGDHVAELTAAIAGCGGCRP